MLSLKRSSTCLYFLHIVFLFPLYTAYRCLQCHRVQFGRVEAGRWWGDQHQHNAEYRTVPGHWTQQPRHICMKCPICSTTDLFPSWSTLPTLMSNELGPVHNMKHVAVGRRKEGCREGEHNNTSSIRRSGRWKEILFIPLDLFLCPEKCLWSVAIAHI